MASAPYCAMISCQRAAISCTASGQEIGRNSPAPFFPVRLSGVRRRRGEWTVRS